jgi:NitT/TauT family transport system substrate-binding protein
MTVSRSLAFAILSLFLILFGRTALAQEKITYLLPAPAGEPAFAPFMIAQHKGYYAAEGLTVTFQSGKGGADVAKQVGSGNADLGGALGDTPLIVRQNGIPVKGVALLGGRPLHQLAVRADRGIAGPKDLAGKTINVFSYQDTSYFATLTVLATGGLTKDQVTIRAAGPVGMWQLVASGEADGLVGAPEFAFKAQQSGNMDLRWIPLDGIFPGMAQAIMASDETIEKRPEMIGKFVRATLKAIAEIVADPRAAVSAYLEAVPAHKDNPNLVRATLPFYANKVYPGQVKLGMFDPARVAALQQIYLANGMAKEARPVEEFFTNRFVP